MAEFYIYLGPNIKNYNQGGGSKVSLPINPTFLRTLAQYLHSVVVHYPAEIISVPSKNRLFCNSGIAVSLNMFRSSVTVSLK